MTDEQRRLEIESAVESIYFATRHLDRAATVAEPAAVGRARMAKIAVARVACGDALRGLADCLPPLSEARLIGDAAVPF